MGVKRILITMPPAVTREGERIDLGAEEVATDDDVTVRASATNRLAPGRRLLLSRGKNYLE
ncbi:hypothetical protein SynPROS91_01149 [Synechococcus sp. PROS-9-1]|nr:hypothetical protein SynPROS91_01149 [Synechococcus sp. PROS-9-1]